MQLRDAANTVFGKTSSRSFSPLIRGKKREREISLSVRESVSSGLVLFSLAQLCPAKSGCNNSGIMEAWMLRPPFLVGETVGYDSGGGLTTEGGGSTVRVGTVRWLGRLKELHGQEMVVGIEMVRSLAQ